MQMRKKNSKKWHKCGFMCQLPEQPGLYALYFNDDLIYIGQSQNMYRRHDQHRPNMDIFQYSNVSTFIFYEFEFINEKDYNFITWKYSNEYSLSRRLTRELALIKRLQPKGNKAGVDNGKTS